MRLTPKVQATQAPSAAAQPAASVPAAAPAPSQHPPAIAPHIHIERLVLDGFSHISTATLRQGFVDAWRNQPAHLWDIEAAKAFSRPLELTLPPHATGHQIGTLLARALIDRVSEHHKVGV